MTNKTSIAFVLAFAAVMLAWPMTAQNVIADGDASITAACGFATPGDIDLGAIAIGVDSTEVATVIAMTGTVHGTLELQATDWTGVGTSAIGSITLTNVLDGESFEVNSISYVAEDDAAGLTATEFASEGTDNADAISLAAQINANDGTAITATVATGTNVVLISADVLGTAGNDLTLTETVADGLTTVFPTDGTLDGAEATGVVHMQAEAIKYRTAVNDLTDAGITYTNKANTGVAAQVFVLHVDTIQGTDTTLYLQASGDSTLELLPYSGILESTFAFGSTCS